MHIIIRCSCLSFYTEYRALFSADELFLRVYYTYSQKIISILGHSLEMALYDSNIVLQIQFVHTYEVVATVVYWYRGTGSSN